MKKIVCFIMAISLVMTMIMPMTILANNEEASFDMSITPVIDKAMVESGDQFLVTFELDGNSAVLPYLTFRITGTFDNTLAKIVAPVYSNGNLGILTNEFDNQAATFKLEGYDQTLAGVEENVVCSILFEAINAGEFTIDLKDDCMLGKAKENAFYNLSVGSAKIEVVEDTDSKNVSIIKDPDPITPFDTDIFGHWAEKEIGVMYKLGALEGIAEDSIDPDKTITRGEFISMLITVCKQKKGAADEPFVDVSSDSFVYQPALIAKGLGVAKGDGEGHFFPDKPLTKQDMYTLIFRIMIKMNKVDSDIDSDKYLNNTENKDEIAYYAEDAWAGMLRAKLIKAVEEKHNIAPTESVSIGEACVVLNKLAEFNILVSR